MKTLLFVLSLFLTIAVNAQSIIIAERGRFTDGREGGSEIVSYDSATQRMFITNSASDSIDIVSIADPGNPVKTGGIDIRPYGGNINSVVCLNNGFIAAAIEADVKQDPGCVAFFTTDGLYVTKVTVGSLPDMITRTKDGQKLLVANEGEPDDTYANDPEGSVAIIYISGGIAGLSQADVTMLGFTSAPSTIPGSLQKPGTPFTQDLEPEYIAVDATSSRAVVGCQDANIFVFIDLTNNSIEGYHGLGFKDHNLPGNGMDASDKDDAINIKNWPVHGAYMPDALASYSIGGVNYWITANEGDSRDYGGYSSETRIKDLTLDAVAFPNATELQSDEEIGRLKTLTPDVAGDTDGDGDVDVLYSYGARSFSIRDNSGMLIWDSGDDIEQFVAAHHATFFNCEDGLASEKDKRSDDKGAEVEAVAVGKIGERYFAFAGLERQGGFMVYDVTTPSAPEFVTYIHTFDEENGTMTDIAPEGIVFIAADENSTGKNMLLVSNELSGTTTIYEIWDIASGTEDTVKENTDILVFPNPVTDYISLSTQGWSGATAQFSITDTHGRIMQKGNVDKHKNTIDVSFLPSGIYFLSLFDGTTALSTRIMKR